MMRIVIFDANGSLEAFDYRGILIHKQEIQANKQATKGFLADFLAVYDKNIEKGFFYLTPKFFLEKEKQLMKGF
ncbi:hypothetical protein HpMS158_12680 [Helicobacter pylori]